MKNKMYLFIALGVALFFILGSSIYVDFIAKTSVGLTYLLIAQIFVGIVASLITLFMGLKVFENKKNHELLFIAFLELLLVLGIVVLNYVYGYKGAINRSDYIDYMDYVSMEFNIYIYSVFVSIIGLLDLNLYIKDKLKTKKENVVTAEKGLE